MKNMKKILALLLVIVLTASVTLGVTLAVLTDETEIKHNVFTAGDVSVELTETVGGETAGGVTATTDGAEYKLVAPGDELTKEVTVENTGSIPAYVAVTVNLNKAAEIIAAIDEYYTTNGYDANQIQRVYEKIFEGWGLKHNASGVTPTNALPIDSTLLRVDTAITDDADVAANAADNWFTYYGEDMAANELQYTYYLYLLPGEDVTLFTGINVPEYFKNEQMAMFNGLEIDIQGAAVQAENFANPQEAFKALRLEQTTNTLPNLPQAIVSNDDELAAAIKEGNTNIWLNDGEYTIPDDAKNKTLTLSGNAGAVLYPMNEGEYGCDYSFDGSNVTFNGVTIDTTRNTGNYKGYARMNATYNNCTIFGAYTTHQVQTFNDCAFDTNNGYIWIWGAQEVTFNGCEFGGNSKCILAHGWESSVVNINNCTFAATAQGFTGSGDNTAAVEIDPAGSNTYTINFTGTNTKTEFYSGWTRVKDGSTGHVINGLN